MCFEERLPRNSSKLWGGEGRKNTKESFIKGLESLVDKLVDKTVQ